VAARQQLSGRPSFVGRSGGTVEGCTPLVLGHVSGPGCYRSFMRRSGSLRGLGLPGTRRAPGML